MMIGTKPPVMAIAGLFAALSLAPLAANADSTQSNKNLWRNLAIGSAAVGGIGLLNHNSTEAIVGVAGAAYSAHRYEEERHSQSVAAQKRRERYYHLHHRHHH